MLVSLYPEWRDGFQRYIKTVNLNANWLLDLMTVGICINRFIKLEFCFHVFFFFYILYFWDMWNSGGKNLYKFQNPVSVLSVQHAVMLIYRSMFDYRTKCLSTDLMILQRLPSETDRLWLALRVTHCRGVEWGFPFGELM